MVKVLLDACVPQWMRTELGQVKVETARYAKLDQLSDGDVLASIEGRFDVFVTLDSNMRFQQDIAGRPYAMIVLRVKDQSPEAFRALVPALVVAIRGAKPGEILEIS